MPTRTQPQRRPELPTIGRPPSRGIGARVMRGALILAMTSLLLASTRLLAACSGPQVATEAEMERIHFAAGERQQVRGEPITLEVPKPFERAADHGWVAKIDGRPVALLRVDVVRPLPEQGMDAILDQRVRAIRKAGVAGVLRDERVTLGDLDGRLIEAVELVGDPRNALLLVATETEDALVTATIAVPATVLKREGDVLRAALRTLRVAAPRR